MRQGPPLKCPLANNRLESEKRLSSLAASGLNPWLTLDRVYVCGYEIYFLKLTSLSSRQPADAEGHCTGFDSVMADRLAREGG